MIKTTEKTSIKAELEGFLNINKPEGITSAQVIRDIKKAIKVKKIGYIGTLDPIATGVLVVGMGRATKLFPFLERQDKVYKTEMTLGSETDTQDRTGVVLNSADPSGITQKQVIKVMDKYVGEIEQIPPMYSAKKIDGKRLYTLARQGISVEREPVKTTIHEINFIRKDGPKVEFIARVSTGSYLRTLCHDMGRELGVYGHLSQLVRVSSGRFDVEDSVELDMITNGNNIDTIREHLITLSDGLKHMPKATVIAHAVERLKNGMPIGVSDILDVEGEAVAGKIRVVNRAGALLGIGETDGGPLAGFPFSSINPKRVFV